MATVKTKYQEQLQARLNFLEEKHRNLLSAVTEDIRTTQYLLCLGKQTISKLDLQESNQGNTYDFDIEEKLLETGEKLIKKVKERDFMASLSQSSLGTVKIMEWKPQQETSDDELDTVYFPSYCKRTISPVPELQPSTKATAPNLVEDLEKDQKRTDSKEQGISVKEMFNGILEKYKKVYHISEESSDSEEYDQSFKERSTMEDIDKKGEDYGPQKDSTKIISNSEGRTKCVRFSSVDASQSIQN